MGEEEEGQVQGAATEPEVTEPKVTAEAPKAKEPTAAPAKEGDTPTTETSVSTDTPGGSAT